MAFEGTPIQVIGNVGRDQENRKAVTEFTAHSGKKGISFSLAVPVDGYDKDATWFDVTTMNAGLIESVKKEIYAQAKGIAVEGLLTEKQGNNGKVFKTIWANRIGVISFLDRNGNGLVSEPAAASESDDNDF